MTMPRRTPPIVVTTEARRTLSYRNHRSHSRRDTYAYRPRLCRRILTRVIRLVLWRGRLVIWQAYSDRPHMTSVFRQGVLWRGSSDRPTWTGVVAGVLARTDLKGREFDSLVKHQRFVSDRALMVILCCTAWPMRTTRS